MDSSPASNDFAAVSLLARLAERGIEYVFANAGTDFAPIVEALARNPARRFPRFITVPHENLAVAMAHGYYRLSGKPAAVMLHVTVGTANALCGVMNASRDNVPMFVCAGRTPNTDAGHPASRNGHIHWGTESFDQGGLVREYVKWDYELRAGQSAAALVDRALDIAMSEPRGPVYLTLPREVLADPSLAQRHPKVNPLGAPTPHPNPSAIGEAARLLADAEFPLIVTSSGGRTRESFNALATLAAEHALPVVQAQTRDLNISTDHPMALGYDSHPLVPKADVILVVDTAVPWIPSLCSPKPGARVIHLSSDPLHSRYPYREFEADVLIAGDTAASLVALTEAMRPDMQTRQAAVARRRSEVARIRSEQAERRRAAVDAVRDATPMNTAWIARCINEQKSSNAIIINELGFNQVGLLDLTEWGSYIGTSLAGGLGFGLGAGLGAKLAAPEREVIVCCGEGSYMFGNPTPYHYVQRAENLPTLTVISNNSAWHAVRVATLSVYPQGAAAKAPIMPVTTLQPAPDYEKVIAAIGGYGEKVEDPAALPDAIRRARAAVQSGSPAVLNVITQGR